MHFSFDRSISILEYLKSNIKIWFSRFLTWHNRINIRSTRHGVLYKSRIPRSPRSSISLGCTMHTPFCNRRSNSKSEVSNLHWIDKLNLRLNWCTRNECSRYVQNVLQLYLFQKEKILIHWQTKRKHDKWKEFLNRWKRNTFWN